jgi:hypothetical protein
MMMICWCSRGSSFFLDFDVVNLTFRCTDMSGAGAGVGGWMDEWMGECLLDRMWKLQPC